MNRRVTLTIDRLTLGGEGVGRADGMAVFVPFTAPGDRIEAEITDPRGRFARARLVRVIQPGPSRVQPPCPYYFQVRRTNDEGRIRSDSSFITRHASLFCGGCSLQHIDYRAQLEAKRELVSETLVRIGGFPHPDVFPTLGMKDPWRYRNKVQQPVRWSAAEGKIISGFFEPGSHAICAIDDCLIQPELSVQIIQRTKALLDHYSLRPYDEDRRSGWVRHLLVRTAESGQKALLVFVTRTPDFPHGPEIVATLRKEFPALVGVHQNVQPAHSNVILGRQWRRLDGETFLEQRLGHLRFRLSAGSFFQVNSAQAEVLYNTAKTFAGSGRRLLDLYTGVGTLALWMADRFEEVGGVEENPEAIRDAQANAEFNGIDNVRFIAMGVQPFLRGLRRSDTRDLTVVLDPPRAGCEPAVIETLLMLGPQRLVYVSCDPATLARDLKRLAQGGYRLGRVQPVDLFPQTAHIETVVELTRGERHG